MSRTSGIIGLVSLACVLQLVSASLWVSGEEKDEDVTRVLNEVAQTDEHVAREKWTYQRLEELAGIIVIAEFAEQVPANLVKADNEMIMFANKHPVIVVESRFKVLSVLRPDKQWKERPKSIPVLHFSWDGKVFRSKSAQLIEFSKGASKDVAAEPSNPDSVPNRLRTGSRVDLENYQSEQFIMFLSAGPDGRYRPVTGQYFPGLSFRRIAGEPKKL